eukprot:751917-Hanusia_phi.AAC.4
MDNTLVDWDGEFVRRFKESFGDLAREVDVEKLVESRKSFEMEENFPDHAKPAVLEVIAQPGFYQSLRPLAGALEALEEMLADGLDVRLVTAPHPSCPGSCCQEKFSWLKTHLGEQWLHRIILTRDKTFVLGDVLIDGKNSILLLLLPSPHGHHNHRRRRCPFMDFIIISINTITHKPCVSGCCCPRWNHVIFERVYNIHIDNRPRIRKWNEWKKSIQKEYQAN